MAQPRIDLGKIVGLPTTEKARTARAYAVARAVQHSWKNFARLLLDTSRNEYIRAVQIENVEPDSAQVTLASEAALPMMRELGMGPGGIGSEGAYDLRTFLLRTSTKSIRQSAGGGLYLNVPFRHSVASIRQRGGAKAVKAARALGPSRTMVQQTAKLTMKSAHAMTEHALYKAASGHTKWGERLPAGKFSTKLQPHHVTDPLAGMARMEKTYAKATQSTYMTWRRISATGKAWMHPGIPARHIAAHVVRDLPALLGKVF